MATLTYDAFNFDPVPMMTMNREFVRTESEDKQMLTRVNITLNGILIASPSGISFAPSGFREINDLREELETALQANRKSFVLSDDEAVVILNKFPVIKSVTFQGGDVTDATATWVDRLPYTIELSYEDDAPDLIQAFSETFSYQEGDNDVISVTHAISVTGLNDDFGFGSGTALDNARAFALTAINNDISPAYVDISLGLGKRNIVKSEEFSPSAGTYALTEQYILASGTFREEFTVSISTNNDGGVTTGSIDGTIEGFGDTSAERFANASGALDGVTDLAFPRVQSATTTILNPTPNQFSEGFNQFVGTVDYSFQFDNNPCPTTSGAVDETIRVGFNNPKSVFASVPIPGRSEGPILQNIGTATSTTKTLAVNLTFAQDYDGPFFGVFDSSDFEPNVSPFFLSQFNENFDIKTRKYTLNLTWTYNGTDPLGFIIPSKFTNVASGVC